MVCTSFIKFAIRRALSSIATLFGALLLVFVISRVLIPNPARAWAGPRADEATVRRIGETYHLYDPVYTQFYFYLRDLAQGNLGTSPNTGQPVLSNIEAFFPATIELALVSMALAILIGVILGVVSASHQDRPTDHGIRVFALFGVASPPFLAALLIQLVFFFWLGIFPDSGGRISALVAPPTHITGLYLVDSVITGNATAFLSSLQHIIMPAVAQALLYFGIATRLTRASMLEVIRMDYVRMARSKGLSRKAVMYKHALRNALIPTTTVMAIMFAYMLGGSVVIESIFQWPGVGRYAAQSILALDYPAVMGVTLVFALCVIVVNFVADLFQAFLDPRVQLK